MAALEPRVVEIPYKPRDQFMRFHDRMVRFAILVARRRGGKTVAAANDLVARAMENNRPFPQPRYAFIGPLFKQTRRNVWQYLVYYTSFIEGVRVNQANYEITLPGGQLIYIDGADNPDAIRGGYLDGCVLDEFQDMKPIALDTVIFPMLGDYNGWLTITGTAKGLNQLYQLIEGDEDEEILGAKDDPEWLVEILPFSGSTWGDEEAVLRIKKRMSKNKFEQEYECSFAVPVEGAIYGKEMTAMKNGEPDLQQPVRYCPVPYNPSFPVFTAWDLGYADTLSIGFFQIVGKEPRCIDYYENNLEGIDHYVQVIQSKPYRYETHVLPHDAAHKSLRTGTTLVKQMATMMGIKDLDIPKHFTVLPVDSVETGIELVRSLLPQLWMDDTRCKKLFNALSEYQYIWLPERKIYSSVPHHNWASHPSDMVRYAATYLARRKEPSVAPPPPKPYSGGYGNSGSWMG